MSTPNGHGEVASAGRSLRWDAEDVARMCQGHKRISNGKWKAQCPAHADKTPSLAIRDGNNGGVVLYCFAGCEVESIVGALGIQVSDLMPDRTPDYKPQRVMGIHPLDALAALDRECLIVLVAAAQVSDGIPLNDEDCARLAQACGRIHSARELAKV